MVNQSFADRYFPGRSAVGTELTGGPSRVRVVGVVGDARELGLERPPTPTVYSCFGAPSAAPWFIVRTAEDPLAAARPVRIKLGQLEPQRPVYDIAPLEERIGGAYAQTRLRTFLLALFAGTALSLACLGVYGTLSYVVSLRSAEVAVRMALGASSRNIVGQYLLRAFRVIGLACAAGLVMSYVFTRLLSGMLYGISPSDPLTLLGVVFVVSAVALAAALLPAMRASRVEPMRTLREE